MIGEGKISPLRDAGPTGQLLTEHVDWIQKSFGSIEAPEKQAPPAMALTSSGGEHVTEYSESMAIRLSSIVAHGARASSLHQGLGSAYGVITTGTSPDELAGVLAPISPSLPARGRGDWVSRKRAKTYKRPGRTKATQNADAPTVSVLPMAIQIGDRFTDQADGLGMPVATLQPARGPGPNGRVDGSRMLLTESDEGQGCGERVSSRYLGLARRPSPAQPLHPHEFEGEYREALLIVLRRTRPARMNELKRTPRALVTHEP
jgi:hypothetical protein